ncbi:MAG: prephenate dehydrogenase [Lachnospiraceae bacterium]|nr:prephenate dehydrogenase [Lachnospiraceae bacterium]
MERFNKVAVVGLGLIGGSMAKTIKSRTDSVVYAVNRNRLVSVKAKEEGVIDGIIGEDVLLTEADLVILGLYPDSCIEFVTTHIPVFKKGAVIVDCCGTKKKICNALTELCKQNGLFFIGGHPMAGIEKSGYDASFNGLFDNASMILCKPDEGTSVFEEPYRTEYESVYDDLKKFFLSLGFGFVKESTPTEHDRIIAYTSQMAHVLSSAYIKSDACKIRYGFSAGSFKDMTRVAYLNETMWTELFLENKEALLAEIEEYMGHVKEYRDALKNSDEEMLCKLLKEGRLCKEADMEKEAAARKEDRT